MRIGSGGGDGPNDDSSDLPALYILLMLNRL